jgi:hypothetical protein
MKIRNFVLSAAALALGVAAFHTGTKAQGPLFDKVIVNLPYSVTVGDRTLQPGEYSIRQLPSMGNASRVLLIAKDDFEFETSAMTIPTYDNNTPNDTKVVLHHVGNDFYFDKIWIQGKNYGYEFILPDAVKARQREVMEPIDVAARYEAVPDTTTTEQARTTEETVVTEESRVEERHVEEREVAQVPAEPQVTEPAPTPAPRTDEDLYAQDRTPRQDTVRQDDVWRDQRDRVRMPDTAANWVLMLLSGGLLSGAGLALRRL